MHSLNQVVIYALRDISVSQIHSSWAVILSHFCIKAVIFQLGNICGCKCVAPLLVGIVYTMESLLSEALVLACKEINKVTMCNLYLVALHVSDIREPDICIVKHRENVVRGRCHLSYCCKDFLLRLRKSVCLFSHNLINHTLIIKKLRLITVELLQFFCINA